MNIIGHKFLFLTFSGLLVCASFIAIGVWGFHFGIDFKGGSLLEVEYAYLLPPVEEIKKAIEPLAGNTVVQPTGERGVILRFTHIDEPTHQEILVRLRGLQNNAGILDKNLEDKSQVTEKRFDTIGPTIGKELRTRSLLALGLAIGAIIVYIALAFRHVSKPVSSWKYGVVAVLALIHDVTIPTGVFAALGHFYGIEVDTLFITALLTILGFSVHDTIVVFDRIRENLRKLKMPEPYAVTVNRSINETMTRSINTSVTVLWVLGAIFFFGGETTTYFALTLILGIIFGTYSSIFVASPLLVIWNNLTKRT